MSQRPVFIVSLLVAVSLPVRSYAKHPVRNVPIVVVALQPDHQQNTADSYTRELEFANREYLNAGIQFTLDRNNDILRITDNELNCWDDVPDDDRSAANWYADYELARGAIVVMSRRYDAIDTYVSGNLTRYCVSSCTTDVDCCPGQYHDGHCHHSDGTTDYENYYCHIAPDNVSYCMADGGFSFIPHCFSPGCQPQTCGFNNWRFVLVSPIGRFRNTAGQWYSERIDMLDHELGHLLGLDHTHAAASARCYDTSKHTDYKTCPVPTTCDGASGSCDEDAPWRNVMSYHGNCRRRYSGQQLSDGSDWNQSFSQEQIALIWRTINEYYDIPTEFGNFWNYALGGYENFYLATSSLHKRYTAAELYNPAAFDVGDNGWLKNHVQLFQGDVNGDGLLDAVVLSDSGTYPGLSVYTANAPLTGAITYKQIVLPYFADARVAVGNIRGDWSDDVVVTTPLGLYVFEGSATSATPLTQVVFNANYRSTYFTPLVANLGGSWWRAVPVPAGVNQTVADAQSDVDSLRQYGNVGYEDVLLLHAVYSKLFVGRSDQDFSSHDWYTTQFTASNVKFAANLALDQHDDLGVMTGSTIISIYRGQDAFASTSVVNWFGDAAGALFTAGNFTGDAHADFVILRSGSAQLYHGSRNAVYATPWVRYDLNFSNTRFVAGDFIRKGYDDVLITTPSGAYVYDGVTDTDGYFHSAFEIWNPALGYPAAVWFGR